MNESSQIKLSFRIGLAFGSLVFVAIVLGAIAIVSMRQVQTQAMRLDRENVPEVRMANNVERSALMTMYEIRAYALSADLKALERGREHLNDTKKYLASAKQLASTGTSLAQLGTAATRAEVKVLEYESLVNATVTADEAMSADRKGMDAAAHAFMTGCTEYARAQQQLLAEDVGAGAAAAKLKERATKIKLSNDVIEIGNSIRLAAWRAQAERNLSHVEQTEAQFAAIRTAIESARAITVVPAHLAALAECQRAADAYRDALRSLAVHWNEKDSIAARRAPAGDAVLVEARSTATLGLTDTQAVSGSASSSLSRASSVLLYGLITAAVLGSVIATLVTRSITRPITRIARELSASADQTASAAQQVASASQSLAAGASEQAASLEETSSSLEEMSSMTKNNADSAQRANDLARSANQTAAMGAKDMQAMSDAMNAIKQSSDDIAKIIKTIDEIAFQTNILALNAAVEAARAGDAGLGFAVVADEVRGLAQRSAVAARETAAKIESAIGNTSLGVQLSLKVSDNLSQIVSQAQKVEQLTTEVASGSTEQTRGIEQLNSAVGEIDRVTQNNASSAEESASAAEEMHAQTTALKEAVSDLQRLVDGSGKRAVRTTVVGHRDKHLTAVVERRRNLHSTLSPKKIRQTDTNSAEPESSDKLQLFEDVAR